MGRDRGDGRVREAWVNRLRVPRRVRLRVLWLALDVWLIAFVSYVMLFESSTDRMGVAVIVAVLALRLFGR